MRFALPSLAVLCLLLLGGCAGLEENRRNSDFGLQMLSFENAIRWGNYKLAAAYIKPGHLETPIDYDAYEGLQITDYKVRNTVTSADEEQTTLDLRISYLRKGDVTVRTLDHTQVWEYEETSKRWWLMTRLPEFK
jgi:hypothetical protein